MLEREQKCQDPCGHFVTLTGDRPIQQALQHVGHQRTSLVEESPRKLLRQPEQFVGTVAERLLMYATGRNLQYYDAPTVRAVMRDAERANHTLASLVLGIVKSRPFQMREA